MHHLVLDHLALVLFLPWFAIVGWAYWAFPRAPRHQLRRIFDGTALVGAGGAAWWATSWAMIHADPTHGTLWPQILASTVAYGAFLGALAGAWIVRWCWLREIGLDVDEETYV